MPLVPAGAARAFFYKEDTNILLPYLSFSIYAGPSLMMSCRWFPRAQRAFFKININGTADISAAAQQGDQGDGLAF